jgi:DNA replication protein DnaC
MTPGKTAAVEKLVVIDEYPPWALVACPDCLEGKVRAEAHLLSGCDLSREVLDTRIEGLATYDHQQPAVAALMRLISDAHGWLTLAGPYGTGKSTLLWACLNELRDVGRVGMYFTAARLLDWVRSGIGLADGSGHSERDKVQRLVSLPVLAIDELDKYHPTSYAENQLFSVLNERYRRWQEGVTLLAYNDASAVHPALLSRIKDGRFAHTELSGPDLRPLQTRAGGER